MPVLLPLQVDPSLDVDLKPSIRARRVHEERYRQQRADFFRRRDLEERMLEMQAMEAANYWGPRPPGGQRVCGFPGRGPAGGTVGGGAYGGGLRGALGGHAPPPPPPPPPMALAKRVETVDDKHVQAKHASIYPSEAELKVSDSLSYSLFLLRILDLLFFHLSFYSLLSSPPLLPPLPPLASSTRTFLIRQEVVIE